MAVDLRDLKARGRYARRRLLLGWRPSARMTVQEGPKELVLLVEAGALARALEVAERFAKTDGAAGGAAVVAALRQAVEEQAALLSPPPAPRPTRPRTPAETARTNHPAGGIDWSQG
ncbi:hypothetical protein ACH4OX_36725 [Streptomyces roseolus]|uniref:hypothetical protein n=1 Tax=Streptomyces roseolus TaxID=67358 RepID=UPI0037BC9C53